MTARRPRASWRRAAFVLFSTAAGTNASTPLLLLYQDRLGLSGPAVTVVFGVYAAGLTPSLLISGPVSDRIGRRPLALPFAALAGAASLVFVAAADSYPLLLVARLLQGAVSGVVFTVGSAWLADLSSAQGQPEAAGRRASVAVAGGLSLGPLVASLLAVAVPGPLVVPYVVHACLMALAVAVVLPLPETAPRRRRRAGEPARAPLLRREDRRLAGTALAPLAACVYAFPAIMIAGLPVIVALPGSGVVAAGVLAGITLGTGAVVAPWQRRLGSWTAVAAPASGALGLALAAAATATDLAALLLPAALLLGAGGGWALAAGMALALRLAPPERRGAVTGIFFTVAYVGFVAPFLITSAAGRYGGALPLGLTAAVVAALALRLVPLARAGRL